jgi:sialate O-acetylesterase
MPSAPSTTFFNYKPVGLYNSMIAPIENFTYSGVVWYQGESNVSNRNEYVDMLTALIADWRAKFSDSELPFYIVELADFLSHDDVGGRRAWAEMRAEQAKAAEQNEHATLIKNSDLGEWNDIHPLDKKTLGNRVAEAAWNDIQVKNINKKKNK